MPWHNGATIHLRLMRVLYISCVLGQAQAQRKSINSRHGKEHSSARTTPGQCDLCGQQPTPNQSSTCTSNACRHITVACQVMNTLHTAPFAGRRQLMHGWRAYYLSQTSYICHQSDRLVKLQHSCSARITQH